MTGASGGPLNRGFAYVETVARRDAGRTVLAHLTDRYRHTDGSAWEERIRAGLVLLDGSPAAPDATLRPGQTLTWMRPPWREPEAPLDWALLYEDVDLVVVAKPSGLPTLPGAGYLEHTLLALVRKRYPEAAPLHRLGRGTSGLVLFARSAQAARALSKAWRERTVTKVYRALVTGSPGEDEFVVETRHRSHSPSGARHGPRRPSGRKTVGQPGAGPRAARRGDPRRGHHRDGAPPPDPSPYGLLRPPARRGPALRPGGRIQGRRASG